jgi:hypothetical protein
MENMIKDLLMRCIDNDQSAHRELKTKIQNFLYSKSINDFVYSRENKGFQNYKEAVDPIFSLVHTHFSQLNLEDLDNNRVNSIFYRKIKDAIAFPQVERVISDLRSSTITDRDWNSKQKSKYILELWVVRKIFYKIWSKSSGGRTTASILKINFLGAGHDRTIVFEAENKGFCDFIGTATK